MRPLVGGLPTWRRSSIIAAAALLVASACGSTLQSIDEVGAGGTGEGDARVEQGLSLEDAASPTEPGTATAEGPTTGGAPGRTAVESGDRSGTLADPSEPSATATGGVAPPPAGTSGRGFTEKEIYIGWMTWKEVETATAAAGFAGYNFGDQERQVNAMIADINERGGIHGRELKPVFYDIKSHDALTNSNSAAQAACERWTKDRPVFLAILQVSFTNNTLFSCMAKNKTPILQSNQTPRPASAFANYHPYLYSTLAPQMERLTGPWMQRASEQGYFRSWDTNLGRPGTAEVKIGILTSDDDDGPAFDAAVREALSRRGRSAEMTVAVGGQQDQNNVVLQFKSAGITHVIAWRDWSAFAQTAETQRYRPRYAISTFHHPKNAPNTVPSGQLIGAVGVGYLPGFDVHWPEDPGDPSPAATRCREIMQADGQDTSPRDAWAVMARTCDAFNFLFEALGHGALSPEGLLRGAQGMGSMAPAATFALSFPGGRTDGLAAVRDLGYAEDCGCFKYLSATNHPM